MAAQEIITDSQLRMVFEMGVDHEGKPIFKNKNFSNIKNSATATALLEIANALAPLQQHPVFNIERNNSYDIVDSN